MRHATRMATVLGLVSGLTLAAGSLVNATTAKTANLSTSASVASNCTITTTPVAFDTYDPVGANLSADKDGSGSVIVACTRGASTTIGLGLGIHASGILRRLKHANDDFFLTYEFYNDAGRLAVWSDSSGLVSYVATSKDAHEIPVYGRIPANQDVPSGSYSDTVVATVNF
jgi:spore coat protein U-like protein